MKDIDNKISYQRWFAAGIVGAIAALIPWAGAIWGLGALGVDLGEGAMIIVTLVIGSFGGAWSYHSLISD
jgi:hypothetical protein